METPGAEGGMSRRKDTLDTVIGLRRPDDIKAFFDHPEAA